MTYALRYIAAGFLAATLLSAWNAQWGSALFVFWAGLTLGFLFFMLHFSLELVLFWWDQRK